jgi:hypothetical protein
VGGACGTDEKMRTNFLLETPQPLNHSEDLVVDGRIILKIELKDIWGEACRLDSSQNRNRRRFLVNAEMSLRFTRRRRTF